MSKFIGLVKHLASMPRDRDEVRLNFAEIDGLIDGVLPASAGQHWYWHGRGYRTHVDLLADAGWSAHLDPKAKEVSFRRTVDGVVREGSPTAVEATGGARVCTVSRDERIRDVMQNLPKYVAAFARRQSSPATAVFTREQVCCHKVTLQRLDAVGLRGVLSRRETEFYELLHATLQAWGMDQRAARLVALDDLRRSVVANADAIAELQDLSLRDLDASSAIAVAGQLTDLMQRLRVSDSGTKMVAFTKAVHHLLPQLVPPMDRQYTLRFFFPPNGRTNPIDPWFPRLYRWCAAIAFANRDALPSLVGGHDDLASSVFNTSEAKLIDNAIVEYQSSQVW